ncbi:MAG: hypothetical protein LIO71_01315 [Ruminococcus sp.]|nr:hypothetical protein [Ruminococcus sp.]MCC8119267.1 hypothetical protein [Bacteroidales bacterium]
MAFDKSIIPYFDAFGWVPTIRGALSLDLFNSENNLCGDVDSYSISFKSQFGHHSEHHLAATTLSTTLDTKVGKKYENKFRSFFYGVINNDAEYRNFLQELGISEANNSAKDLLIGEVVIVVDMTDLISDNEIKAIRAIQELKDGFSKYRKEYFVNNDPFETLKPKNESLVRQWKVYHQAIEDIIVQSEFPVFRFKVLLSRDGLLFIKDLTAPNHKIAYSQEGTVTDYAQHIPLPRIFKQVMNFVKFLFHSNYHHNRQHDTYLPPSNLHPTVPGQEFDFERIFIHQRDAFVTPIIKLKRKDFNDYSIDPNGVLCYARAFITVCKNNHLISEELAKREEKFLDIQEKEVIHMTQGRKSVLNTLISQCNPIFVWSGVLAMAVGIVKLASMVIDSPKDKFFAQSPSGNYDITFAVYYTIAIAGVLLVIFGWVKGVQNQMTKHSFKRKTGEKWSRRIWLVNSDLNNKKLSMRYRLYIGFQTSLLKIRATGVEKLKIALYSVGILLLIILIFFLIRTL